MSANPAISIVTPTRNRAQALRRAIESVRRQSLTDYEHIVVDDCSGDDTEAVVRGYADPRLRYVRFDRWRGANPARNVGIRAARADLVTFLDSDDEYLPGRLGAVVEAFDSRPSMELLLSSFETVRARGRRLSVNPEVFLDGPRLELAIMAYTVCIAGTSISVRRSTILKSGGFEPTLLRLQDREALLRLSQVCGAQLSASIDWRKHVSHDSISRPRSGYVEALGRMIEVHPHLGALYRPWITYHIARHLLCDLLRGRIGSVRAALRANAHSSALRLSFAELAAGYRAGAAMRRQVRSSLREGAPRTEPTGVVARAASRAELALA